MRELFPHQADALRYAQDKRRIALFMEMRLGKSLVTIRWAQHHNLRRVLILAPMTVCISWEHELQAEGEADIWWLAGLPRPRKQRMAAMTGPGRTWYLLNYEGLRAAPELLGLSWDAIVCDESTAIRNPQAQITKLLIKRAAAPYRAILSGLPAPESPWDYFTQMEFLHGSFMGFGNFWAFRNVKFRQVGYDWEPKPGVVDEIKRTVHERSFVLTRKQAKMGNRKIYERRVVAQTPEQARYFKQIRKEFKFDDLVTKFATTQHLWLQRLAGGFSPDKEKPRLIADGKLKELKSLVTGELRQEPIIVWFRFNEELTAAYNLLADVRGLSVDYLTGEITPDERKARLRDFQKERTRVFLIQARIGQYSLNLSRASTAIYYSNYYDMEVRAQSEDRIEHPSKSEPLLIMDLVTGSSIDEDVVDLLQEKKVEARAFMRTLVSRWAQGYRQEQGLLPDDAAQPRSTAVREFPE